MHDEMPSIVWSTAQETFLSLEMMVHLFNIANSWEKSCNLWSSEDISEISIQLHHH